MNDLIQLSIDKIVFGGSGMGHIEGKVCFVPFVLPGEEIKAKIVEEKKDYLVAECLEILKASPERIEAICEYFGSCGGCHYQNIPYQKQQQKVQSLPYLLLSIISRIFFTSRGLDLNQRPPGYEPDELPG